MNEPAELLKRYSAISYISLSIGIVCFFLVFVTPTRVANTGNPVGDTVTLVLTSAGILLSLGSILRKTEKKLIAIISLLLSSSFFIFWMITLILLFTGEIDFAP